MQFSTPLVAELAGATVRQARCWGKTGVLRPSGKATGHRRYTFPDLVALKMIKGLRGQGLSLQKIRKATAFLRKNYPKNGDSRLLASLTLLTDGQAVFLLSDENEIRQVMTNQVIIWAVAVGRLIQETREQTDRLPVGRTEEVQVRGKRYHLDLTYDADSGTYTVQCRELPGAIEQGDTAAEAIANGKSVIGSVLDYLKKRKALRRRSARSA